MEGQSYKIEDIKVGSYYTTRKEVELVTSDLISDIRVPKGTIVKVIRILSTFNYLGSEQHLVETKIINSYNEYNKILLGSNLILETDNLYYEKN